MKKYEHTKKQWIKWYMEKVELMAAAYEEVSPYEFYRDMFPVGSFQEKGKTGSDKGNGMVDIIKTYGTGDKERTFCNKYILTDELKELSRALEDKTRSTKRLCLCSPVSYYGRHKSNDMAHELFAMVLDIDYVGVAQLKNMMKQIGNGARTIPPNYIVNSGRGIHLYYLLEEPVPCYKYMIEQLTAFKKVMEDFTWNETTSLTPEKPDHGACTQAFRMVGAETKLGKEYITRAYKVREERWTIPELYAWIDKRAHSFLKGVDLPQTKEPIEVYRKRHPLTMEEAKRKYPEWNPSSNAKKWVCKDDLYHWWIRQIEDKAIVGGRYYSILALASYGAKCNIPMKQVEKDAMELLPYLESLTNDEVNHFTKKDIADALKFYRENRKNVTYKLTREKIVELSKIDIKPSHREKGKRLKQAQHLELARYAQKVRDPEGEWRNKDGAPSKEQMVKEWRSAHPEGRKIDCERETGLSRHTVLKWWNA